MVQKSVAFLCTKNEAAEREVKQSIPFYNCTKTHKIPRNKSNQRGEKSIHWRLEKAYERN